MYVLKRRNKTISAVDEIIVYVENLNESTINLLQLISSYSKVSLCMVNVQKSVIFLYTRNKRKEFEIKTALPIYICTP